MKGLELSRRYYEKTFGMLFENELAPVRKLAAAGLSGEGSECFGFDDEISRDHDFSPEYCVWLPYEAYKKYKEALEEAYDRLPRSFEGYQWERDGFVCARRGIQSIEGYFQKYTGLTHAPSTHSEWLAIPETFLAVATNGEVFEDGPGEFGRWKKKLKEFYPQDVLLKKLAARLSTMAQSGQYNYPRCVKRGDIGGAYLAGGEFVRSALSAIYLLNREYMPFYKWSFYGAARLYLLRESIDKLEGFIRIADNRFSAADERGNTKIRLIEEICKDMVTELKRQGFSLNGGDFLIDHAKELMSNIKDPELKKMNMLLDVG